MTLQAYYRHCSEQIAQWYATGEAAAINRILWEDLAGIDRATLLREGANVISPELQIKMEAALARLEKREPIQYVCGHAVFMGMRLQVNRHVLIPRPETEELVQWILNDYSSPPLPFSFLDIGTGSGCIAIALRRFLPEATITAVDASDAALEVAAANARKHACPVDCRLLNFLEAEERNSLPQVHVIVSNPPYIPAKEASMLDANVRMHEPPAALFVPDDDPLLFYRALAAFAGTHLLPDGALYVETHERYARDTAALFSQTFRSVEIKTDLNGRERMVKATNS